MCLTVAMLDYLERTADPDAAELEALSADFDITLVRPGGAAQFVAHISGQAGQRWTLDDFDLTEHRRRKGEPKPPANDGRTNLYDLTVEFQGYLRREEGVSYAKGELARDQIQQYILERYAGKLSGNDDRRETRKTGRKARASAPVHLLCPDRDTVDRYLVGLLRLLQLAALQSRGPVRDAPGLAPVPGSARANRRRPARPNPARAEWPGSRPDQSLG